MANTMKKFVAILMAAVLGMSMGLQAIAATTTETETTTDGELTTTVTTTTETTEDGNTTTVVVTVETKKDGIDEDGATVDYDETKVTTTQTSGDTVISEKCVTDGKESLSYDYTEKVPDVDVDLIKDGKEIENPSGSAEITPDAPVSADPKEDENDTEYDETKIVSKTDREVNAEVNIVEVEDYKIIRDKDGNILEVYKYDEEENTGLEPISSQWDDNKQDVKKPVAGMTVEELKALDDAGKLPVVPMTEEEIKEALKIRPEGYDYLYVGLGEDSYYGVGWNFVSDNYYNGYGTGTHQFALGDFSEEEMKLISAYCADLETSSRKGYWYTVQNVEDADYYDEESAKHIRTIASNAYWGVIDDPETKEAEFGSLAAVKAMMAEAKDADGNPVFTEAQINGLTEGEALTASQMAIWKYGNPYQKEDGETIYIDADTVDYNRYQGRYDWTYSSQHIKDNIRERIIAEKQLDVENMTEEELEALNKMVSDQYSTERAAIMGRINALANYLMNLTQTDDQSESTQIINEKNYIEDMSMTVGSMVKENADGNGNNSYNVDFTFSLVVTPGEKDDLIIKVINSNGEVVGSGRVAGDGSQDDGFNDVYYDEKTDSYTLTGLELIEGSDTKFNLKLEGAQYLERGVYIYTSEVRDDTPSQTFVGIAEGYKSVDTAMEIDLSFNVEEGTVTTLREWHSEGDPVYRIIDGDEEFEEEEIPLTPVLYNAEPNPPAEKLDVPSDTETILDEDVPLAAVPGLGDESSMWLMVAVFAFVGFMALNLPEKKREED
ncbi:MAG: Cys-Gln thioester bond-forming surface protein [Oscillospiraceae bacterium]|nr:Cys-Gln thioester bond-forming surface protein [Oscillospiraceae bacterium]